MNPLVFFLPLIILSACTPRWHDIWLGCDGCFQREGEE